MQKIYIPKTKAQFDLMNKRYFSGKLGTYRPNYYYRMSPSGHFGKGDLDFLTSSKFKDTYGKYTICEIISFKDYYNKLV